MPIEERRERKLKYINEICADDFIKVAEAINGFMITRDRLQVKAYLRSHIPEVSLPSQMSVTVFAWGCCGEKVVIITTKKQSIQQYDPNIKGTFANILLKDMRHIGQAEASTWIRDNIDRIDYRIDRKCNRGNLKILKLFLKSRLNPYR